ncbi:hypothetical protein HPP92_025164 [Vanilla planifolia]|uniref:K-box domain-containing protein n=1 Tax=Vanilla planifolia TaxID=51239 RepID=A0A835PHC9_VANPL|nr:hypothetical protein HPP92_025164 [Vanilla planifolia]
MDRSRITKTIERYQRCNFSPQPIDPADHEAQNWYQESSRLKAKYESLQRSQRHLLGEDLDALSLKELQHLERQLESSLSLARKRRTEIMLEQMEELKKKEHHLGDINKQLKHELGTEGGSMRGVQGTWASNTVIATGSFPTHATYPNAMDAEPILQIGYHHYIPTEATIPRNNEGANNCMHGWAL